MEERELTEQEAKIQIEKWKDEYGDIFITEINDTHFIFRGLSRAEFKKSLAYYEDDYERAEYVARLCVLDPIDVDYSDDINAGIPETLAKEILECSGLLEGKALVDELLNKYTKEMSTLDGQMPVVIAEVFNQYTIEEIDKWPLEKMISYFCKARWALQTLRGVELTQEES